VHIGTTTEVLYDGCKIVRSKNLNGKDTFTYKYNHAKRLIVRLGCPSILQNCIGKFLYRVTFIAVNTFWRLNWIQSWYGTLLLLRNRISRKRLYSSGDMYQRDAVKQKYIPVSCCRWCFSYWNHSFSFHYSQIGNSSSAFGDAP
jgi:hypothetical protein